jgi:hypothetical protein
MHCCYLFILCCIDVLPSTTGCFIENTNCGVDVCGVDKNVIHSTNHHFSMNACFISFYGLCFCWGEEGGGA